MTFIEKYKSETTWHGKAIVTYLFHTFMTMRNKDWTIKDTANEFGVSIGLVSENLKLANAIDKNPKILSCPTRQDALTKIRH